MMEINRDVFKRFQEGKRKILGFWSSDRVIKNTEKMLIVQCENDTYIIYRFIAPTGIPELDEMFANKILIQWTDDLNRRMYINLAPYILGKRKMKIRELKEAVKELAFRIKMAKELL